VAENEPIFNFMYLRPVETLAAANEQRDYIRDLDEHPARTMAMSVLPRDSSLIDDSPVTKIVCRAVFGPPVEIPEGIAQLKLDLLTLLVEVIPVADINNPPQNPNNAVPIPATELERYAYMVHEGRFFLLPDLRVPIIHPCWSGSMSVSVEGAAESVPSVDIEMRDPLRISDIEARDLLGIGDWSGPGLDCVKGPAGRCSL
jgi:hypothetical protein